MEGEVCSTEPRYGPNTVNFLFSHATRCLSNYFVLIPCKLHLHFDGAKTCHEADLGSKLHAQDIGHVTCTFRQTNSRRPSFVTFFQGWGKRGGCPSFWNFFCPCL